ncbi:phospholipase A2-like [Eupeodes corollae]|uniref:phospholipase A2-like n=1 Tax=Eupeodes corollae TaxID=290404 RepID=UPI002492EC65|nr:phospholipase A2-like [Eupeodes corollae]
MGTGLIKNNINSSFWAVIIVITSSSVEQWKVMSQLILDSNSPNEVFDESISNYDNGNTQYPNPTEDSLNTNFSAFLLSQSRINFSDKTTREGLDITSPQMFQSKTIAQLNAVFPGTVWCGVGDVATDNNILGHFSQTDSCCRTHDKCRLAIPSGSIMFGLENTGYFTRSHCSCDEQFYDCLKRTNSFVSNKIGYTYFNLLKPQCFRKTYPIVACWRWFRKRCKIYMLNQSDERRWQWFDNSEF